MSTNAKIETLTNSWYGFTVVTAAVAFLAKDFGLWSIFTSTLGLLVSLFFVFMWGRALQRKSSLARYILIVVSGISTLVGGYGAVQQTWLFVHAWEIKIIIAAVYSAVSAWMMAKSFRTLTDSSVKAYFA